MTDEPDTPVNWPAVAVALAGLVITNLAIDVAVIWLMEDQFPGEVWYDSIPFGLLMSQILLLGLWLGLGDGYWWVRASIAFSLTVCVAFTIRIAFSFVSERLQVNEQHNPWGAAALAFMIMMLIASCFALVVKRV